jgi:hypothetical protein
MQSHGAKPGKSIDLYNDAVPTALKLWPPVAFAPLRKRSRNVTLSWTPSSGEMEYGAN